MEPLAVVTRKDYIESVHHGIICIVNASGDIISQIGDSHTKIFFRSSAKPIQAIPLIRSGAADEYRLSGREIAIACASHSGQEIHQDIVKGFLNKLNLSDTNLHCGAVTPYNREERKRLMREGLAPSALHCACSGKHTGMLTLAQYREYDLETYEKIENPAQQEILKTVAEFAGLDAADIPTAIDGCGAPVYLLPAYHIALSYARLIQYSKDAGSPYHASCKSIYDAMVQYPEMVAGENEFDTELMRALNGALIGKSGNEAVYCLGIKEQGLGVCVKIADGSMRALYPVVVQVLKELNLLSDAARGKLSRWHQTPVYNNSGERIGAVHPYFSLSGKTYDKNPLGKRLF